MSIRLCLTEIDEPPVATKAWSRDGRAATVIPLDSGYDTLAIRFQRKLHPDDVEDGRLRLFCREFAEQGGKRVTEVALSFESAENLYEALGQTLKRARRRRRFDRAIEGIVNVFSLIQQPR